MVPSIGTTVPVVNYRVKTSGRELPAVLPEDSYRRGMKSAFQVWFLERRKEVHGTQARAASAIGTTEKTVREWEQGTPPRFMWVSKIAHALAADEAVVADLIRDAHLERVASAEGAEAVAGAPTAQGADQQASEHLADATEDALREAGSQRRRGQGRGRGDRPG